MMEPVGKPFRSRTPVMRLPSPGRAALAVLFFLAAAGPARPEEPRKAAPAEAATPQQARKAAERGLAFLVKDAAQWRKDRGCATCHHGTMTVWALSEAKGRCYAVDAGSFADTVKWTKERLATIDKPRDTRPGWSMVSTPAVYLAVMALAVPTQDALSADELKQIAGHL